MSILPFIAAILPALILGFYVWIKDPYPEPIKWILKAAIAGVLISIPVVYIENFIQTLLFGGGEPFTLIGSTVKAFCVAAIPEEGAKLLALWIILRKNPYFDEHFDGIVYAVFVSLGFAAIENVGYVMMSAEGWLSTAIMRALLAVPGHYAFAILMGYYYSLYHFVDHSRKNALKMFVMPVLAHGVYDAIAMSGSVDPIIGSISTLVLIVFCIKLQKEAKKKLLDLAAQNNQPTYMG